MLNTSKFTYDMPVVNLKPSPSKNYATLMSPFLYRDIEPLELVICEREAALGPKQYSTPHCLTCLAPVQAFF